MPPRSAMETAFFESTMPRASSSSMTSRAANGPPAPRASVVVAVPPRESTRSGASMALFRAVSSTTPMLASACAGMVSRRLPANVNAPPVSAFTSMRIGTEEVEALSVALMRAVAPFSEMRSGVATSVTCGCSLSASMAVASAIPMPS